MRASRVRSGDDLPMPRDWANSCCRACDTRSAHACRNFAFQAGRAAPVDLYCDRRCDAKPPDMGGESPRYRNAMHLNRGEGQKIKMSTSALQLNVCVCANV